MSIARCTRSSTVSIHLDCSFDCWCSNLQALKLGGRTARPPPQRAPPPPQPPPQSRPPRRRGAAELALAHRVWNAEPFGRWSVSNIFVNATGMKRLIGIGANCHASHHKGDVRPNLPCNTFVTITQTADEHRARWLAKLWLLEGSNSEIQDRAAHVRGVKVHELDFYKCWETETDLDTEAFILQSTRHITTRITKTTGCSQMIPRPAWR